jgi:hypothetical protein
MSVREKIQAVVEHAPTVETREHATMAIGEVAHQGDIYVHRVAKNHPRGEKRGTRKIAIGEGEGSHHFAVGRGVTVFEGKKGPAHFKEPEWVEPGSMVGPVVVAESEWTVSHPTHPHHRLPAGTYQVTYQADFRTKLRVRD